jgi:hypothetical protein
MRTIGLIALLALAGCARKDDSGAIPPPEPQRIDPIVTKPEPEPESKPQPIERPAPRSTSITDLLKDKGIRREMIEEIRFAATEGSYGPSVRLSVRDRAQLDGLWDLLADSEGSGIFCACLLGRAELFTQDHEGPAAEIVVKGDDGLNLIIGREFWRLECRRFRAEMDRLLGAEYKRRRSR